MHKKTTRLAVGSKWGGLGDSGDETFVESANADELDFPSPPANAANASPPNPDEPNLKQSRRENEMVMLSTT
jgi:hypothetical protein